MSLYYPAYFKVSIQVRLVLDKHLKCHRTMARYQRHDLLFSGYGRGAWALGLKVSPLAKIRSPPPVGSSVVQPYCWPWVYSAICQLIVLLRAPFMCCRQWFVGLILVRIKDEVAMRFAPANEHSAYPLLRSMLAR